MELGHRVNGSFGSSFSPGHWVIILTRCETRVFPVFEKMPKMQNVHLKCWNGKSHCQVSVVRLKSLDVSPCNELWLLPMIIKKILAWEYFFTHKSTFGVRYRTRKHASPNPTPFCGTVGRVWGGGSAPPPQNLLFYDLEMAYFGEFWGAKNNFFLYPKAVTYILKTH